MFVLCSKILFKLRFFWEKELLVVFYVPYHPCLNFKLFCWERETLVVFVCAAASFFKI